MLEIEGNVLLILKTRSQRRQFTKMTVKILKTAGNVTTILKIKSNIFLLLLN